MKKIICSVLDIKSGVYGQPMIFMRKGDAVRSFSTVANEPDQQIGRYPEDFVMYQIAEFDDTTGEMFPNDPHINFGKAVDYVQAKEVLPASLQEQNH